MAFLWSNCAGRCAELPGCDARPCDAYVRNCKKGKPEEWEPDELDRPEIFNARLSPFAPDKDPNGTGDNRFPPLPYGGLAYRKHGRQDSRNTEDFLPLYTEPGLSGYDNAFADDSPDFRAAPDDVLAVVLKSKLDALAEAERAVVDPRTGLETCQLLDVEPHQLSTRTGSNLSGAGSDLANETASLLNIEARQHPSEASYSKPHALSNLAQPASSSLVHDENAFCECGHAFVATDVFCGKCGRRRHEQAPSQQPHEPTSQVTSSPSNSRAAGQEFQVGQHVEFQTDFGDDWQKGVVSNTAPLHVRPDGCNISSCYPRVRPLEESPKSLPDGVEVQRTSSNKFAFLRDRLGLGAASAEDCGFFFFHMGPFLKLSAPQGISWGDHCASADPGFATEYSKILIGAWAECMHAAVVYENSNPRWKDDPDYNRVAPTQQVTDYFEACGHSEHTHALEELKQDTRRRLESSGASGISSSRCSSRCSSPCPSSRAEEYSVSRASG